MVDQSHSSRSVRILVVDDNVDAARSLESLLRLWGYDVRTAFDGREALDAMTAFSPECVISDIHMPRLNGYELAKAIRADSAHDGIVLVAYSSERELDETSAAYFDHRLIKPVDLFPLERFLRGIFKVEKRLERAEKLIESQSQVVGEARDLIKEVKSDVKEIKEELKRSNKTLAK